MTARRARRSPKKPPPEPRSSVECAPLEPIRIVERMLTRPDGTKLRVKVPVYPPFRLPDRTAPSAKRGPGEKKKAS